MILFPSSKIVQSTEMPVATGFTVTAEGAALVADRTSGVFGAKMSAGVANEQFLGVSLAQQLTLLYVPKVESLVQGAPNTITLAKAPASGSLRVVDATTGTVQTLGAATNANEYSIVGQVITLPAAQTGHTYTVYYRYSPTTVEARTIQGDIPAGGAASLTLGSVGVITQGTVVTSEYDTSVDWSVANPVVKLGANGLFTIGGSGVTVPNAYVTQIPSATDSFLGVHFSA